MTEEIKSKSDLGNLLEDLELLWKEALRGVVSPPDFGTEGNINKAHNNLKDYISKENDRRTS